MSLHFMGKGKKSGSNTSNETFSWFFPKLSIEKYVCAVYRTPSCEKVNKAWVHLFKKFKFVTGRLLHELRPPAERIESNEPQSVNANERIDQADGTVEHTDAPVDYVLRIKLNGPDEIADFQAEKSAKRWLDKGHLASNSQLK